MTAEARQLWELVVGHKRGDLTPILADALEEGGETDMVFLGELRSGVGAVEATLNQMARHVMEDAAKCPPSPAAPGSPPEPQSSSEEDMDLLLPPSSIGLDLFSRDLEEILLPPLPPRRCDSPGSTQAGPADSAS